jgi:hypothetical protein
MTLQAIIDELRQEYRHVGFFFVTSPTERCGITLLQRMINATGSAIIYGENGFLLFKFTHQLIDYLDDKFDLKVSTTRSASEQFYGGNRGMDGTQLFPDFEKYAKEVLRTFYRLMEFYQIQSKNKGFDIWGIKCPLPAIHMDPIPLLQLLPRCRMIIVDRSLEQIARSHCARWPEYFTDQEGFYALGYRWMKNRILLKRVHGKKILRIIYDDWMQNPDLVADQIEKTFDISVDRNQIREKINVQHGVMRPIPGAVRRRAGYYLPPADLPAGADAWLREGAEAARRAFAPRPAGAAPD